MTSARFVHSVSGRKTATAPDMVVPGLWRLEEVEDCFLNRVSAQQGDAIVADRTGRWVIAAPGQRLTGRLREDLVPDSIELENVRVLGERLEELESSAAGPEQWLSVPPLVPGIHEKVVLQAWEESLPTALEHLRIVCYRPRTHLHTEVERVPVSRARRVSGQGIAFLSAHPEDWERRTLTGVRPRRVLAVHTGESLDIYENRLAARLIDRLLARLTSRIRELRGVLDLLTYSLDFAQSGAGTRWRRDRVYRRWGHMAVDEEDWDAGRVTLTFLEARAREVRALLDSPLYRGIDRGLFVSGALKRTNLLTKDQHYRHVAALWLVLGQADHELPPTPEAAYRSAQRQLGHFERFSLLLVAHGLAASGFHLTPDEEGWCARGQWGTYMVRRGPHGAIELQTCEGRRAIRFVPLCAGIVRGGGDCLDQVRMDAAEAGRDRATRSRRRGSRIGALQDDAPVVVLYSGTARELSELPRETAEAMYVFGAKQHGEATGLLPVATQDIDSVERIARAIRWVTMGSALAAYPPRVTVPAVLSLGDPGSGIEIGTGELHVREPVTDSAERMVAGAVEKGQRAAAAQGRARMGSSGLDEFKSAWRSASEAIQCLAECPLCGATGRSVQFEVRTDREFAASCHDCDTRWGIARCGGCMSRLPFFLPARNQSEKVDGIMPSWVDAIYGADLLSIPSIEGGRVGALECQSCRPAGI